MRRSNAVIEQVSAPSKGLLTHIPSNLASPDKRAIVAGENVRAERGVLSAAPGFERIIPSPSNLDSPANMIFQSNILNIDPETRNTPFIGTGAQLYTVMRRAKALVCDVNNGGGGSCSARVGFLGDSGRVGSNLAAVATLIKSWSPDFIIHTGDIVYADGVVDAMVSDYEECVGQYFGADYVGGYNGIYGVGPVQNKFFPTLGNHDWDDGGIFNYLDFFTIAKNPNERYYHYKRGPLHFVHLDSGGNNPGSVDPDGYGIGSGQADWLEGVLAGSDCPFLFVVVHFPAWTSDSNYYPGNTDTQSLASLCAKYNVTAIISGHAHNSEVLMVPNVAYSGGARDVWQLVSGTGGHSLRSFNGTLSPFQIWGNDSQYAALRLDADRQSATFQFIAVDGTVLRTQTFSTPRENSGICYIGDAAKEVFTLEIRPPEASVEVGASWAYRAFANYQDGTVEDVTEESIWVSNNDTVGAVGTTGIAVGHAPGIVTITATYKGVSDEAILKVLHSCVDDPTDVIFCLSRSGSMGGYSGGSTRLEAVKEAVRTTIDAFDPEIDRIGLSSFAGIFVSQTEDSTLDSVLTSSFDSVKDALSLLVPDGANGISSGLDMAYAELIGGRHTSGNLRAVVLVVDWPADVTNPGGNSTSEAAAIAAAMATAATSADMIKGLDDTTLVVFGYNVPSTYRASISNLATAGYYFDSITPEDLKTDMASLPHILCFYNGDKYYYPPDPHCGNPVADFQELFDWDIVRGTVDLAGIGPGGETDLTAWDPRPGNGMYLDLIGTNVDNSPDFTTTSAKIQTKQAYPIVAGKSYELTFDMCSYVPGLVFWTDAIVKTDTGTVFGTLRVTPPADGPFITYTLSFTAASSGDARIIFDHQSRNPDPVGPLITGRQGNLLDNVRLANITDAVELFFNDFNNENPCEI